MIIINLDILIKYSWLIIHRTDLKILNIYDPFHDFFTNNTQYI